MHPRCRSTISAVVEGGKRTARVGGKNIKVPADWNYEKWRASVESDKIKSVGKINLQQFSGKLPEGNYNLTVRRQVQNRHIEGTREYQQYSERLSEKGLKPSILNKDIKVAEFAKEFHRKGIYDPNPKNNSPREKVDAGKFIGKYWDKEKNQYVDTTWVKIVYSKHGVHIYPIFPEGDDEQ